MQFLDHVMDTQDAVRAAAQRALATYSHAPDAFRSSWDSSFARATQTHRLTLLYIANEIFHQERRRGGGALVLTNALAVLLPAAFSALARDGADFLPKLQRIVQVWRENDILNPGLLNEISRSSLNSPHFSPPPLHLPSSPPSVAALQQGDGEDFKGKAQGDAMAAEGEGVREEEIAAERAEEEASSSPQIRANLSNPSLAWMLDFPPPSTTTSSELNANETQVMEDMALLEMQSMDLDMGMQPQNRNALHLYQILVSVGSGKNQARADALRDNLPNIKNFAQQEAAMSQTDNEEEFERVETVEPITLNVREMHKAVQARVGKLQEHQDQAEKTLVGLVELLGEFESTMSSGDAEQDALARVSSKIEFWEGMLRDKLEPMLIAAKQREKQQQQEAEQSHKRVRTSRWGDSSAPILPSPWQATTGGSALPPPFLPPPGAGGGLPPPFRAGGLPPAFLPPAPQAAPVMGMMSPPFLPHQQFMPAPPPSSQHFAHPPPQHFMQGQLPPAFLPPPPPPLGGHHHSRPPPPPQQQQHFGGPSPLPPPY